MKRYIIMLAALVAISRPGMALADADVVVKDPCLQGQEYNAAVWAQVKGQDARAHAAKAAGDLVTAAQLTPYRWVEAHWYNAAAYNICRVITAGAPKGTDATDYYLTPDVRRMAQDGLDYLILADQALAGAKLCATASLGTAEIQAQVAACTRYINRNRLFLERVLGLAPWPKESAGH